MPQTILITGVTSGFGRATAELFYSMGWRIVGVGRRRERLAELQGLLGDDFLPICLDVRDKEGVATGLGNLPVPFDAPDVLFNNAGLALGLGTVPDIDPEDWETMLDTNIRGLLHVTRAIVPGMVKRNRGHIVNVGSVAGTYPYAGGNVYGATKSFVHQFSLNLRADLAGTGIRVSCLEPGLAKSEFSDVRFKGDTARADAVYAGTEPLNAHDIAEAVRWVTSLPPHVNINTMEIMPVCQAPGGPTVSRS